MARFLLDTNAIGDSMVQHPKVTARLHGRPAGDQTVTCVIVGGEIRHGIERLQRGRKRAELERQSALYFGMALIQEIPVTAVGHYALTKVACIRSGVALNENDLWIAATALAWGATLVTRDKDFTRAVGLTVEGWSV